MDFNSQSDIAAAGIEVLKVLASMVIPLLGLLRTRTDLDRFAAAQRAKELGTSMECQLRKRWYHGTRPRYPRHKKEKPR